MDYLEPLNVRFIAQLLGPDKDKWNQISGALIRHADFGVGRLVLARKVPGSKSALNISVEFPEIGVRSVTARGLVTNSSYLTIRLKGEHAALPYLATAIDLLERQRRTQAADEKRAQMQREDRERQEKERHKREEALLASRITQWELEAGTSRVDSIGLFEQLARKWHVPVRQFFPDNRVLDILVRLEKGRTLSGDDLALLAERGAPELADGLDRIRIKEIQYARTGDVGILATLSKEWRRLHRPERALEATGRVIGRDQKLLVTVTNDEEAILLTTRGGAYRDVGDRENARRCAQRSIALRPNHGYAYCLLGAIDVDEGAISSGEASFSECERLSSTSDADALRHSALRSSKYPAEYAAYLLDKDPVRFSWAERFL